MNRFRFIVYRPLQLIPVLIGVTLASFILIHAIPGDPGRILVGAQAAPDTLAQARMQYGLDHPLPVQYVYFLKNLFHGELGQSVVYKMPVFAVVFERLWPTLFLVVYGAMLSLMISIGLAILAARHEGGLADRLIRAYSTAGLGMPTFWIGIILVFVFSVTLKVFPASGFGEDLLVQLHHLFLPALTVALSLSPLFIHNLRASMLQEMRAPHVAAARARGLPERAIFRRHVLLNSLIPAVKLLDQNVGWLVGITVVAEQVFAIPGLGGLIIGSISTRDYLVVQAVALLLAAGVVFAKFLLDVVRAAIDPRVKL